MAYDTLSPYAGAYPQTKEEIPTSEATGKAMRQAGRDLGVGSLRFGAWAAMAPEIDWLVNRFGETGAAMMMADPSWQDLQKTHPKETEDFRSLWLASKGLRGDEQHQEYAKKRFNKYHDMGFWAWAEQTPEVIDKIVPFENTLGSEAVEDALILLSIGWGVYGITRLLQLGVTKGVPWLRNKIKSIVKNKQGEEVLDDIVPEASLQIEHKPPSDARIDKTVERTMEGAGEVPLLPSVRTGYMPSTSGYASPKTKMYHGAKGELPEEFMGFEDYASSKSSAYGDGFYTTSRTGTGKGYAGKEGKLYEVTPKKEVKLFDMEGPVPPSIKQSIKRGAYPEYGLKDLDPIVRKAQMEYGWQTTNYWDNVQDFLDENPKASLVELYDEMRALAPYEDLPAYEVDEYFHGFASILQESGYQGLRHKGGVLSSRPKKHEVNIYWNPGKDLNIKPVAKADLAAGEKTVERATAGEKAKDVRDIDPVIVEKRIGNLNKKRELEADKEVAKIKKEYADTGIEEFTENGKMFVTKPDGMTNEEALKKASEMYKRQSAAREKVRKKWKEKLEPLYEELDEADRFYKGEMKKSKEYSAETKKILGLDPDTLRDTNKYSIQSRIEDFDVLKKRFNKDKRVLEIEKRFQQIVAKAKEDFMEGGNEALFHKRLAEAKQNRLKEMEKALIELSEETDRFFHTRKITKLARGGLVENKVNYALNQWK